MADGIAILLDAYTRGVFRTEFDRRFDYLVATTIHRDAASVALHALEYQLGIRAETHSAAEFLRLVKAEKDSNPSTERLVTLVAIVDSVYKCYHPN